MVWYHVQFSLPWRTMVPTFSTSTSRFTELKWLGVRCCSQEMGASPPTPRRHGSCPVAPAELAGTGVFLESLLESPIAELSLDSNFPTKLLISIPRDQAKYDVHQAQPLYSVRLDTSERSPGIPEGAVNDRLTNCHSFHR